MRKVQFLNCLTIYMLLGLTTQAVAEGNNYALFFAVEDYSSVAGLNNLTDAIRTSQEISGLLVKEFNFTSSFYKDPSKQLIINCLADWRKKVFTPKDQLFIYFSGHGQFRTFTQKGYFVLSQSKFDDFDTYLDVTDVFAIIEQIPCRHIFLMFDACKLKDITTTASTEAYKNTELSFRTTGQERVELQLINPSRLLVNSGGSTRHENDPNHSEAMINHFFKLLVTTCQNENNILIFKDLTESLLDIRPVPQISTLKGHEGGGFVFYCKKRGQIEAPPKSEQPKKIDTIQVYDQEGNNYPIVKLNDNNYWLAQNLRYQTPNAKCELDYPKYCEKYGLRYSILEANLACKALGPKWRLPTDEEWRNLTITYGGLIDLEKQEIKNIGDPTKGFTNLLVGGVSGFNANIGIEGIGEYWSASLSEGGKNWIYKFCQNCGKNIQRFDRGSSKCYVRCIRDK